MAKDGTEILEIIDCGKTWRMNSSYRPCAEAEKFAQQFVGLSEDSVLFVFGYGLGIFPKAIAEVFDGIIVFFEPEKEIAKYINNNDPHISVNNTHIYIIFPDDQCVNNATLPRSSLSSVLEHIINYANYKKVEICSLPKYRDIYSEEYERYVEMITYRVRSLKGNIATAKYMGQEAVENNILNMKYMYDSYCADSLRGLFPADMPAIIVSAGPSLEKNIEILNKAKGHALIICVDSAIKYLLGKKIIPDYVISIDPKKSLSLFDDDSVNGVPVIGSFEMNYRILELLSASRVIFASTENDYVKSLYKMAGHDITRLKSGGSVATMAYSVCCYWGFTNIIMVGQDLALTDSKMYAGKDKLDIVEVGKNLGKDFVEVEDINGNRIYTYTDYYAYLKWFEQMIELHPEVNVIDATEGGARIKGSRIMTLNSAISEYGTCIDYTDYLSAILIDKVAPAFGNSVRQRVVDSISQSKSKLSELKDKLGYGIVKVKKCIEIMEESIIDSEVETTDKLIEDICIMYNQMDESFLIQRQIDATELEHFLSIFDNINYGTRTERYKKFVEYFECLFRAVERVSNIWNGL